MAIHRCPECGQRLHTNYCDICMRKVPFAGARPRKYRDPWDYSSSHREETGHKCITFDAPATAAPKQTFTNPKTTYTKPNVTFPKPKPNKKAEPKVATVVAIVVAILSLLPTVMNIFEDVHVDNPVPEYNVEAFVPEENLPALLPTDIYSEDGITIIADSTGMYYDEPAISFWIDNGSDRDIDVVVEYVAVNGYMVDAGMSAPVNAGESCQAFLNLYSFLLGNIDAQEIAFVDLRLRIYDRRGYEQIGYVDLVRIETELADSYSQPAIPDGWEMIQESDLTLKLLSGQMVGEDGCSLSLHLENHSDNAVGFYTNTVRVNGQNAEGAFAKILLPNALAAGSLDLYGLQEVSDLSDITEIYIEYCVESFDAAGNVEAVNGTVLFNPNALPTSD